jgi:PhnB protein
MTSIQPELWVETPGEAVAFYEAAFGATVLHRVGEGDDIVAQLGVGDAAFWVAATSATMKRLSPRTIDGATSRTLLVVDDPERIVRQAVAAGATESSCTAGGSAGSSTHSATSGRSACLWEPGRRTKAAREDRGRTPATWPKPRKEDGAFMEPRGCNRWQSAANRLALETAKTSEICCRWLPPVDSGSTW